MADVLDLYAEGYKAWQPLVCFDERPCQLLGEVRDGLPAAPGRVARYDNEYERFGSCTLFIMFQPLAGWRHATLTPTRKKADFAECMPELVDVHFPHAEKIRVVLDNLNTHSPASLYDTFPAAEARRILRKLEFHFTPKHGSWLNMAEIELSVLSRQCLRQRLSSLDALQTEVTAWQTARNAQHASVDWRFTVTDARLTLKRLYPC
jgi:hypothetical protein